MGVRRRVKVGGILLLVALLTGCARSGPNVVAVAVSATPSATSVTPPATPTSSLRSRPTTEPTLVPTSAPASPTPTTALPTLTSIPTATIWPSATPKVTATPQLERATVTPRPQRATVTPAFLFPTVDMTAVLPATTENPTIVAPPAATSTDVAGSVPFQLAPSYVISPRPDGSLSRVDGVNRGPIRLAPPTEPWVELPWSAAPNGRTVAFVSGIGVWTMSRPNPVTPSMALWMVDSRGTRLRGIVNLLPPRPIDLQPGSDDQQGLLTALATPPVWNPDGTAVAFVSAHQGNVDLYLATLDGKVTRLTNTPDFEASPRWSPDGKYLAYLTATNFGSGGGWSDAGFGVVGRRGGAPILEQRNLQFGDDNDVATQLNLAWAGSGGVAISLAGLVATSADVWFYPVPSSIRIHVGSLKSAFPQGLEWDAVAQRLTVIWGTADPGKFLQFWRPGDAEAQTLPDGPVDQYAWNHGGTVLAYTVINRSGNRTLYSWRPGQAHGSAVTQEPVDDFAWDAQGKMLAFDVTVSSAQPGVYRWSPAAPSIRTRLSKVSAAPISWSLDGKQLAIGTMVVTPNGQELGQLTGVHVQAIDWGPQGLFYRASPTQSADLRDTTLWLWDGKTNRQLDTGLSWNASTGLILPP